MPGSFPVYRDIGDDKKVNMQNISSNVLRDLDHVQ